MQLALDGYNHAVGERLDYAGEFLKALQRSDAAYEESSQEALNAYRESVKSG